MDISRKITMKMFAMKTHQRMSKTFYDYSIRVIIIPYMYGQCKCNKHTNEKSMRSSSDVAYTWSGIYNTCDGLPNLLPPRKEHFIKFSFCLFLLRNISFCFKTILSLVRFSRINKEINFLFQRKKLGVKLALRHHIVISPR